MLKVTVLLLCLFVLLDTPDCDPQKQDERVKTLEADVKQLKAQLAELKQKPTEHHYELRNEGFRTWRFDPATGEMCIQLTSDADWNRKNIKSQGCECVDQENHYAEMPLGTDSEQKIAQNYYNIFVKPACGE